MMSRITLFLCEYNPDEIKRVNLKFILDLFIFHATADPDNRVTMTHDDNHRIPRYGPRRAPGETTFGSYSAQLPTLVPQGPSRPPSRKTRTTPRKPNEAEPRKGDIVTFGSDSAQAVTYVPPAGTDRQIDNFAVESGKAGLALGQFRTGSPAAPTTSGTRTSRQSTVHTPRIQMPVETLAKRMFRVGSPLGRPSGWNRHPETSVGVDTEASVYSQGSMERGRIELRNAKDGVTIQHIERV
jgi:hypothetical protein